jgi:5-methylcytosine-specific restriction endonuclease McrA
MCLAEGREFPELTEHVDHIVPVEQGGEPWARGNLQGLCPSHHSQKTRQEQVA